MRQATPGTKAGSVVVAPIDTCHTESFHAAWDAVARERRFLSIQAAPSLAEVHDFVRSNLAAGNPHLVALCGDQVVGWCDIVRYTKSTMVHRGAVSMGLLGSFRDQGLGSALLAQTMMQGWAAGFKRIELIVRGDNQHALALYRKAGFAQESLRRKAFLVDGHYYDLINMAILHPDLETHEATQ